MRIHTGSNTEPETAKPLEGATDWNASHPHNADLESEQLRQIDLAKHTDPTHRPIGLPS